MSRRSSHSHRRIPSASKCHHHGQATTSRTPQTLTNDPLEHKQYYQLEENGQYYSYDDSEDDISIQNHYENDDDSLRRYSRTTFDSERTKIRLKEPIVVPVHKDVRRVYPNQVEIGWIYPEASVRNHVPRSSDRPQSSMSSGVTSTMIVDGCGGKCQTFENVCYFFLQLVFMMGILIGASLCIAGLVLRKSAARNLQVLVYIGALLASVSGALLAIQWNARNNAKKRRLAIRNAKRAPIPMETLKPRQQVPLMVVQQGPRVVSRPLPPQPQDEQGVPWWRRRDLR